ncbi:MAG: C45 family peptidase [Opitutaceae bacterium]
MTPAPALLLLQGGDHVRGRQHGAILRAQIHRNVNELMGDLFTGATPARRERILAWQNRLRTFCFDHWPWLEPEMRGLAEGSGVDRATIELLNFRAWQYDIYHAGSCSSFAVPDVDGNILTAGTLDDPRHLYAIAQCQPITGLRYLSFPIAGTTWTNRGMNESGLTLGISSLICPGVKFDLDHLVPVDLVFRFMLQFCSTVAEIEAACRKYKFFGNLIAVDRQGGVFSSSNYCGDLTTYPAPTGVAALTNHPVDAAATALRARGFTGPDPGAHSVERLKQLNEWTAKLVDRAKLADVQALLGAEPKVGRVNNPHTAFATIALPQVHPHTLWLAEHPVSPDSFHAYDVRTGEEVRT